MTSNWMGRSAKPKNSAAVADPWLVPEKHNTSQAWIPTSVDRLS